MKNILFLHSSAEMYGSDRSLLNLIRNMDPKKYGITVILPENGPLVTELNKVKNVNVIIKEIATLRRKYMSIKGLVHYGFNFVKSTVFLKDIIKKNQIDVVYTNTSVVFPGGVVAKLLRKKSVWHIREIIGNKHENFVVSKIVNLFSDVVIANSRATANAISSNTKKVKVIYNAIDSCPNKEMMRTYDSKDLTIGMAGRINRWKGQKLFVEMAAELTKTNSNLNFVIAGDVYSGEDFLREELIQYIKQLGLEKKVRLLGQVNDMESFYKEIDIFVLPSINPEPFGLVILEAMERELPVVATNHGGPTEIINDKVDGFLVDYRNAKEMSEVVAQLVNDNELRHKVAANGKDKRNRVFTLENYVENITQVIDHI